MLDETLTAGEEITTDVNLEEPIADNAVEGSVVEVEGGDVFETPTLALPKKTPEIHEGVVVTVETRVGKDSGSSYGAIVLQSKNTGLTYDLGFFPPQAWYDGENWTSRGFNVDILSDEPVPGKKNSPQQNFAINVASSDAAVKKDGTPITEVIGKEAPPQLLLKLAKIEGFTLEQGTKRPTNGTEYVENLNSLVAGRLEVFFTLTPKKDDANPQFDGQLKVSRILGKHEAEKPNFEKRFATYRKAWQQ